jgi:hypothetical protein
VFAGACFLFLIEEILAVLVVELLLAPAFKLMAGTKLNSSFLENNLSKSNL